ncbi:hypothetical protein MRX96_010104 [Rhipicephalus microplus]
MCASVSGKTSRTAGLATNDHVLRLAPPRVRGSLAYLQVSFAAELARPLSCLRAVLTGRRHQPAAHTPRSWRATMCASVVGKTSRPAGTATKVQVRHLVLPPRVRGSLAYLCSILCSIAGSPAFLHLRRLYWAAAPTCCLYITPQVRGTRCASVVGKTSRPAGTATNVQVRHPVLPPRVRGSLAYLAVSFAALLARRLSCICTVFTGRRHQPAAYTSHPKVREGHLVRICGGENFKGLRAPRPTSRCRIRRRRLESAGAWPTLKYPLQQSWLARFPAFARS